MNIIIYIRFVIVYDYKGWISSNQALTSVLITMALTSSSLRIVGVINPLLFRSASAANKGGHYLFKSNCFAWNAALSFPCSACVPLGPLVLAGRFQPRGLVDSTHMLYFRALQTYCSGNGNWPNHAWHSVLLLSPSSHVLSDFISDSTLGFSDEENHELLSQLQVCLVSRKWYLIKINHLFLSEHNAN